MPTVVLDLDILKDALVRALETYSAAFIVLVAALNARQLTVELALTTINSIAKRALDANTSALDAIGRAHSGSVHIDAAAAAIHALADDAANLP